MRLSDGCELRKTLKNGKCQPKVGVDMDDCLKLFAALQGDSKGGKRLAQAGLICCGRQLPESAQKTIGGPLVHQYALVCR